MFSPRAGTSHGAPRALDTCSIIDVVKAPSTAPRTSAGAFAAMAAGASHIAVLLSWTRRRASVATAAAAAQRLLWLLDAVAAAAQQSCSAVQLAVRPFMEPQRSQAASSGFETYLYQSNHSASHK